MMVLCLFMTSSYCRTYFLAAKLRPSTFFWADSMLLVRMPVSRGSSSGRPIFIIMDWALSPPKSLIRSSSKAT